jgi:hypothetical protein
VREIGVSAGTVRKALETVGSRQAGHAAPAAKEITDFIGNCP